jgi:hypothetical protein
MVEWLLSRKSATRSLSGIHRDAASPARQCQPAASEIFCFPPPFQPTKLLLAQPALSRLLLSSKKLVPSFLKTKGQASRRGSIAPSGKHTHTVLLMDLPGADVPLTVAEKKEVGAADDQLVLRLTKLKRKDMTAIWSAYRSLPLTSFYASNLFILSGTLNAFNAALIAEDATTPYCGLHEEKCMVHCQKRVLVERVSHGRPQTEAGGRFCVYTSASTASYETRWRRRMVAATPVRRCLANGYPTRS